MKHMEKQAHCVLSTVENGCSVPAAIVDGSSVTMDLFQHPYYRLNKTMMTFIGQWPHQSTRTRRASCSVLIYFYVTETLCRMRTIFNNHEASNIVMDCMVPMVIQTFGITFFLCLMLNSQKTLKLLNRIRTDWQVWAREREVNILHEYTEIGKNINIVFAVTVYSGGFLVAMEPIVEKIIDITLKNGTEPGKFILIVDYYHVDEQKYYFYVVTYFYLSSIVMSAPEITTIFMLVSYTLHGSAIFAALRRRLERIGNNEMPVETDKASYALDDRAMVQLAWCVDRHNDAIDYVNLMEAIFTWNFFVSTGIGMLLINALGLQVLTKSNNIQATMTCGSLILLLGLCFLIICIASQTLTDHSVSIRDYIYNSQWYRLSPKAQKLLQSMTMRCNVPSQLTAGNMMVMSMKNVGLMARTAVSYFAFVRSTQGL